MTTAPMIPTKIAHQEMRLQPLLEGEYPPLRLLIIQQMVRFIIVLLGGEYDLLLQILEVKEKQKDSFHLKILVRNLFQMYKKLGFLTKCLRPKIVGR